VTPWTATIRSRASPDLRPGEKLHEQLHYDAEQVELTSSPKVLRAIAASPPSNVRDAVREILALATGEHDGDLRVALMGYVAEHDRQRPADVPAAAWTVLSRPLEAPGTSTA